jgi:hypothetical protein
MHLGSEFVDTRALSQQVMHLTKTISESVEKVRATIECQGAISFTLFREEPLWADPLMIAVSRCFAGPLSGWDAGLGGASFDKPSRCRVRDGDTARMGDEGKAVGCVPPTALLFSGDVDRR